MYIELNILLAVGIDCTEIMMIVGLDFRADCVHRICFSYYLITLSIVCLRSFSFSDFFFLSNQSHP